MEKRCKSQKLPFLDVKIIYNNNLNERENYRSCNAYKVHI